MNNSDQFTKMLADTIKKLRKYSGLSQKELAQHAGVGKTVIYDIEHGKPSIRLNTLLKVLHILNIKIQLETPLPMDEEHA